MQFFPADIFGGAALGSGAMGSAIKSASGVSKVDFSTPEGVASSFQAIMENVSAYNEANTTGVPLTERSTRENNSFFNSEDFKFLKGKLGELGVAEDRIDEFLRQLAATSNNPTIGKMRSTVTDMLSKRASGEIDKQEMLQFSAFLGKLEFSSDELAELEELTIRGEGLTILKKIKEKIAALQQEGKSVDITREDLDAIVSACDLDSNAINQIMEFWNKSGLVEDNRLSLNKEVFDLMFGSTMAALEIRNSEIVELSENLEDAIQAMLENKKNQAATGPVADMRGSALSERSETMAKIIATLLNEEEENGEENTTGHLIDDKEAKKLSKQESIVSNLLDEKNASRSVKEERELLAKASGAQQADPKNAAYAAGQAAPHAEKNEGKQQHAAFQQAATATESGLRAPEAGNGESPEAFGEKPGKNSFAAQQSGADEAQSGKSALNAKVQDASGVVFSAFSQAENSSSTGQTAQAAQNSKAEIYHERIFEQVEKGILKNAIDGSRQITLRLDPPELGKLTLSLTVAQGEVKALIRTESAATTQVVSEQLAQLKQSLEEQGFKVASLEVETRADSHAGTDNWNGAEQHNQEREMLEQSRFMRLARIRAREGETLAQSMQYVEQPASISASGLHIIA